MSECGYSKSLGKVNMRWSHLGIGNGRGDCSPAEQILNVGPKAYDMNFQEMKKAMDDCYEKAKETLKEKSAELEKVSFICHQ